MKILNLNLKKKWFDMTLSGVKKEEYREIKPFWIKRLNFDVWNNKPFDVTRFMRRRKNRSTFYGWKF